jgi:hypothetical protein
VSFTLIRRKCQLCSSLSLKFRSVFARLLGGGFFCRHLNKRTSDDRKRVAAINLDAPDCSCEKFRMSKYSPRPVKGDEILARLILTPMHIGKKGNCLPSTFSQAASDGCSIQRETIARSCELATLLKSMIGGKQSWHGVLLANCQSVRDIKIADNPSRTVCVFDTSNKLNPAHAELCHTHHVIEEADRLEVRRHLFAAFSNGTVIATANYRNGEVLKLLAGV